MMKMTLTFFLLSHEGEVYEVEAEGRTARQAAEAVVRYAREAGMKVYREYEHQGRRYPVPVKTDSR